LVGPLVVRLKQLETELTKKDRVADAKAVKDYRERLPLSDAGAPGVADSKTSGVALPGTAKKSPGDKGATGAAAKLPAGDDRKAATWALARGGKVDIEEHGAKQTVRNAADLPKGRFEVLGITIDQF